MECQERGAEDGVCPQHQGLPEQKVGGQQGASRRKDQADGQGHLSLRQVALGAWRAEQTGEWALGSGAPTLPHVCPGELRGGREAERQRIASSAVWLQG